MAHRASRGHFPPLIPSWYQPSIEDKQSVSSAKQKAAQVNANEAVISRMATDLA